MIVYVNGDSFAAGSELVDFVIPGWPGFLSKKQKVDNQSFLKKYETIRHNYLQKYINTSAFRKFKLPLAFHESKLPNTEQLIDLITFKEREAAWPNLLAEFKTDLNVVNNAHGGAGIAGICHRSIVDISRMAKEGNVPDLVIIQLTSTIRQEIYSINNDSFMYEMPLTEDAEFFRNEHRDLAKAVIKTYEPIHYLFKYLHVLICLNESIKSITGKYPILVDSVFLDGIRSDIDIFQQHIEEKELGFVIKNDFRALVEFSRIQLVDTNTMYSISQDVEISECPLGHLSPEVHKQFAKYIYETYIEGKHIK